MVEIEIWLYFDKNTDEIIPYLRCFTKMTQMWIIVSSVNQKLRNIGHMATVNKHCSIG